MDTRFNPKLRENQYRMIEICDDLRKVSEYLVVDCPMWYFKNYADVNLGIRFPVPEKDFDHFVGEYNFVTKQLNSNRNHVGIIDGKVVFW